MDNRRFSVEDPTSSSRVRRDVRWHSFFSSVIQHSFFKAFILMIIISNAFIIALEEEYNNTGLFRVAEWVFLIFYALEFCVKVYVEPHGFWRSGSNVFSAALLLLFLVAVFAEGATSFFSMQNFRPIRALRILKIISFSPTLQALVVMLAKAMKRALYVMCLVFFIMFIFAVAGVLYFGEQATGDVGHWGNLWSALLTVFGLITLDSWVDLLKKVDSLGVAYSRLFPIIFILVGHFVFFNMLVGLVIMEVEPMMKACEEALQEQEQEAAQKRRKQKRHFRIISSTSQFKNSTSEEALQEHEQEAAQKRRKQKRTMKQLTGSQRMMKDCEEALREQQAAQKRRKQKRTMKQLIGSQVSKLKKWSNTNVRADENFPQIIQQLRMSLSDSDYVVTKDKSSSLTFLQIYLTTLRHQDTTLARLQQIYDEMLEVLSELLELQQEDQREEKDDGDAP
ncbi:hypothetical protein SRHO_G00346430 [Serrasalmus rhombeus]